MAAPAQEAPAGFTRACALLRAARPRRDVVVAEVAAPTRVAPHALAMTAELSGPQPDGEPGATGRFVLLHDPAGQPGWDGDTRIVVFVRAAVDDVMTRDPLLAEVAWSWLLDALRDHDAPAHAVSGTVTTTMSRRFGTEVSAPALGADGGPEEGEVELRCSWSPDEGSDAAAHLAAFCDVLGLAAGVAPLTPGVAPLRPR